MSWLATHVHKRRQGKRNKESQNSMARNGTTDDLSAEEMFSLESAAAPSASNHATVCPPGPKLAAKRARKTMIQIGKAQ
jgi:hypothetical protein